MNARTLPILGGLFLLTLGSFAGGMWTTHADWKPWQLMDEARLMWKSWRATGLFLRDMTFAKRQAVASDDPFTVTDPAAVAQGDLLVLRLQAKNQMSVAELYDPQGKILHSWPIDYSTLVKGGDPDQFPHAELLMPDGSLLLNFDDGHALARIDACGKPMWVRDDKVFHHAITRGTDGVWVLAEPAWDGGNDQSFTRIDPETGKTVEEISLLRDVIPATPGAGTVFTLTDGYKIPDRANEDTDKDILHVNDVEELTPDRAAAFPTLAAGDLLVSMRNINLVGVIDRKSHAVKWAQYGPWRDQHDPDFEADGTISVFSNNMERNRSTLLSINPATGQWRDLFQGTDLWFSSFIMGKHERLANGNWLIASAMEGRVLEATPDGRTVREFNNIIDEKYNSILSSAQFVPKGYLAALPACAN